MRTIEQYNDFVRRKCELANRRVAPPKAPNRQPEFVRARDGLIGDGRAVGESLTDVPLIGFVQRLAPEVVEEAVEEAARAIEIQTDPAALNLSRNAIRMMERANLSEQEVRDHLDSGAIERQINTGHINKILEARKHQHAPHVH